MMHLSQGCPEGENMAEKSILDMSNDEILELIARNKLLREEATQEKAVVRAREQGVKETKTKAKAHATAATDILKQYLESTKAKPPTRASAQSAATDILKAYMEQKGKSK